MLVGVIVGAGVELSNHGAGPLPSELKSFDDKVGTAEGIAVGIAVDGLKVGAPGGGVGRAVGV